MENTQEQKTPETLKPEQMESGKWYFLETNNDYKFVVKFKALSIDSIDYYKSWNVTKNVIEQSIYICPILDIHSIRTATKEEVLKYFPDEVFESIELRPEDLVSGEIYKATYKSYWWIFEFEKIGDKGVYHLKSIDYENKRENNGSLSINHKYYHATPEEKKLLLGEEEPTDWKSMYNELKSNYELAKNDIEIEKDLRNQWHNHYFKLKEEYNELKSKYDQLEPKGEKVYFYFNEKKGHICFSEKLEVALNLSPQDNEIYEAVCIGVKKSVLVNE